MKARDLTDAHVGMKIIGYAQERWEVCSRLENVSIDAAGVTVTTRGIPRRFGLDDEVTLELICPRCESTNLHGHIVTDVYDGVLVWVCAGCGHAWPRFSPDPETGYARRHDAGLRYIEEMKA